MSTDLLVQDVPPRVLARLTADARRRGVSINDATVQILADSYGVAREPTGGKFKHPLTRPTLLLTLPDELHRRIKMDAAARKGVSMRGLIIQKVAEHYKIAVASPARRPRGTTTAR